MAVTSLAEHIKARQDRDLVERFVAAAEQLGLLNAESFVESNLGALVAADIHGGTTSIAEVHAQAVRNFVPQLRPGQDPSLVSDDQIKQAVIEISMPQDDLGD